jgi:hypothetical protein
MVKNMKEELLKAELKLVELNQLLVLIKSAELDRSLFIGDIEKLNYDLEMILERFRP